MSKSDEKAACRQRIMGLIENRPDSDSERRWQLIAQLLRQMPEYRLAKRVFIAPAPHLRQARINCLADGKDLVMPSAGLKEGFLLLRPEDVPFPKRQFAVTLKGVGTWGRCLRQDELAGLRIGIVVADGLAVDDRGVRLGRGDGVVDLTFAILSSAGALASERLVVVVPELEESVTEGLPQDSWDIMADALLTGNGVKIFDGQPSTAGDIVWSALEKRQIRRMTPLFHLWQKENPLPKN